MMSPKVSRVMVKAARVSLPMETVTTLAGKIIIMIMATDLAVPSQVTLMITLVGMKPPVVKLTRWLKSV